MKIEGLQSNRKDPERVKGFKKVIFIKILRCAQNDINCLFYHQVGSFSTLYIKNRRIRQGKNTLPHPTVIHHHNTQHKNQM